MVIKKRGCFRKRIFETRIMNRQTTIVIITPTLQTIECWGNLKKACIAHGWAYNTLSKRKLPIEYEGYRIERVPFL